MAKFEIAFALTGHSEAGYANNHADHGGETFAGIARNFWPNWSGWAIIDAYKSQYGISGIDKAMFANPQMTAAIAKFYKSNFWDVNKLDLINNQQIADNIYDFGVNSGVGKAAKTLQQILGMLTVDGNIGDKTISAVNGGNPKNIYQTYNIARCEFYNKLAANPGQLQFLKGWMSRIKPYIS